MLTLFSIYPESMRLDRFLRTVFSSLVTQGVIEKGCRKKQILVNQKPAEPKTRVLLKDEITLLADLSSPRRRGSISQYVSGSSVLIIENRKRGMPNGSSIWSCAPAEDDRVKFQDLIVQDFPDFCVINKPYGLPSQGGPGIVESVDQLAGDNYWIVHRLDQNTEGLMLLAKNRQTASALGEMFKTRQIQKYYYAIVRGRPAQDSGVIDVPLENRRIDGDDTMVPDPNGKKAVTQYRVVKQLNTHHSLVLLKPLTGRKHQLRVHMQTLGTPILGDMKYGKRAKRMHLYAYKIGFVWQGKPFRISIKDDRMIISSDTIIT